MNENFNEINDRENTVETSPQTTPPPILPQNPNNNNRKGGGFKMAIIILLVMLIVAVGVLVAYMIIRDNNSQPIVTEEETTVVVDTVRVVDTVKVDKTLSAAETAEAIAKPVKKDPNKYVGHIGKYSVEGYIYFKGDQLKGKYRYIRQNGAGGWLDISGERSSDGSFLIYEMTSQGNICGYWKCHVQGDKIIGNMTNSKGEEYAVDLSRE